MLQFLKLQAPGEMLVKTPVPPPSDDEEEEDKSQPERTDHVNGHNDENGMEEPVTNGVSPVQQQEEEVADDAEPDAVTLSPSPRPDERTDDDADERHDEEGNEEPDDERIAQGKAVSEDDGGEDEVADAPVDQEIENEE